jgi:HPt (histidine-containing phosphotransfer) domain-containing protein
LEDTYWLGIENICRIRNVSLDTFLADVRNRYPHYALDIAVRLAVATYFYESCKSISTVCPDPVWVLSEGRLRPIGSERAVLDQTAFERTAHLLPPNSINAYVQAIAERAEALLYGLRTTGASEYSDNGLAEAANAIAGSAGLFGFDRLAYLGCSLERAIESESADTPVIADGLRAALQDTLSVIHNHGFGVS